jgi:hypothetical protein
VTASEEPYTFDDLLAAACAGDVAASQDTLGCMLAGTLTNE